MANHSNQDDHSSGSMDVRDHERMFAGFVRMVSWGAGIAIGILILLALANS